MNKKGILPLIFLIPLIIVSIIGLIIAFFVLKWVIGVVIYAVAWTLTIAIFIGACWSIWFILDKLFVKKKKRKRR